ASLMAIAEADLHHVLRSIAAAYADFGTFAPSPPLSTAASPRPQTFGRRQKGEGDTASSVTLAHERWSAATSLLPNSGGIIARPDDVIAHHERRLPAAHRTGCASGLPERLRARVREPATLMRLGLPDLSSAQPRCDAPDRSIICRCNFLIVDEALVSNKAGIR